MRVLTQRIPPVIERSYWKLPFKVDVPKIYGDFPYSYAHLPVRLPVIYQLCKLYSYVHSHFHATVWLAKAMLTPLQGPAGRGDANRRRMFAGRETSEEAEAVKVPHGFIVPFKRLKGDGMIKHEI